MQLVLYQITILKQISGFTTSGDGTSNRHINYDARHVHLKVPDYNSDDPSKMVHRTRFVGIRSSPDQSSEAEVLETTETFEDILKIYHESPLAERSNHFHRLVDVLAKWFGANSDHCSKEKKAARLMAELKQEAIRQKLGEDKIGEKSLSEIEAVVAEERMKVVENLGGQKVWDDLSPAEKAKHEAAIMKNTLIAFGEEEFNLLPPEEQAILDIFIWVGCGCHKDANAVQGGNKAMMEHWPKNGLCPPVLLANKDNAAVLAEVENIASDQLTPAQIRAILVSARGGVKTASIAGFIFNHKDDKKGQQDVFCYWFELLGIPLVFPDISNTRYGSYCKGATVLIQHRTKILEFLEFIKDKKDKRIFTHMEKNLKKALEDIPTLTELAVLSLYSQSISCPYMRQIRGSGTEDINMLERGPLHDKVRQHMEKVIADPDILISENATYTTGAMDGEEWENPAAVKAVLDMAPTLPHLKGVLVAFFEGAMDTWRRFTTEFDSTGPINKLSAHYRDLIWMPRLLPCLHAQ
jgi:hypothetical protein